MKIIISHDVDHLNWAEHWCDTVIPKIILRSLYYVMSRQISLNIFLKRINVFGKPLHNITNLITFDSENGIIPTFFWGMARGVNLSYSVSSAQQIILSTNRRSVHHGVHGIATTNIEKMKKEFDTMRSILNGDHIGIRMHYLRLRQQTLEHLAAIGYCFDSTVRGLINPYKIGSMWEFPLTLMDVDYLRQGKNDLAVLKKKSMDLIAAALDKNIKYFTINYHDVYFSERYPDHYHWYVWLVKTLKNNHFEFTTFSQATMELARENA